MSIESQRLAEEQRADTKKPRGVAWYRTPLPSPTIRALHTRCNFRGGCQTVGFMVVLVLTGTLAVYSVWHWPWWMTVLVMFVHGTCSSFSHNAVHELGHGTVFKTRWLNSFFEKVFGFFCFMNLPMFDASHARHHQFTLHPPEDLEVVLPIRNVLRSFFQRGFVDVPGLKQALSTNFRIARGEFRGQWELILFPPGDPAKRREPVRWSRQLLVGHGIIFLGAIIAGILADPRWLIVPLLINFPVFYAGWLFFLCNSTQHIGLQDNVSDFRLCCRTFLVNPVVQFLYWHMNFHIEHHMYAAVPCYKLGTLHRLIRHDLAPCPKGLLTTWKQIAAIQERQALDPRYQYAASIPNLPLRDATR